MEALTAKTCSPRPFSTFTAMLLAALRQTSSSVTVDVLTDLDLEAMRADAHLKAASSGATPQDKRYLILTHTSDFDRAHYPLPLSQSTRKKPADQVYPLAQSHFLLTAGRFHQTRPQ